MSTTTLHYNFGSSDKIYEVRVVSIPGSNLFDVEFSYGRRGNVVNHGKKAQRVTKIEADRVAAKLIGSKTAKGYQVISQNTGVGSVNQSVAAAKGATVQPPFEFQLLSPIGGEAQDYLSNDNFGMQEKKDGIRCMIEIDGFGVKAVSRGRKEIALPSKLSDTLATIFLSAPSSGRTVLDGELINDQYFVFDMPERNGADITKFAYANRYIQLTGILEPWRQDVIQLVEMVTGSNFKQQLFDKFFNDGAEGVVFKTLSGHYLPGRSKSDAVKHKFIASATCVHLGKNPGIESFKIGVLHNGQIKQVGNCSIAGKPLPEVGGLVEIQYLYAFQDGSLFQPVYKGIRDDKTQPDAYESLKFKQP